MAKKGGLGRGLEALLQDNSTTKEQNQGGDVMTVKITQVEPNKKQPRKLIDQEKIQQLADSLKEHGVIQPLVVRQIAKDHYQIVAGERRWRAAKMAKLKELPIIVREYNDQQTAEIALVENLQREDLNPIEEAEGYQALMNDYNLTQEEVATKVGKSRPAVANALRLMQLPDDVIDLVKFGKLSAGHARALIPLGSKAMEAAGKVISGSLSVRETERLVKKLMKDPEEDKEKEKKKKKDPLEGYIRAVEVDLTEHFGRKVSLKRSGNSGRVEIEFYSDDDLNVLLDILKKLK